MNSRSSRKAHHTGMNTEGPLNFESDMKQLASTKQKNSEILLETTKRELNVT